MIKYLYFNTNPEEGFVGKYVILKEDGTVLYNARMSDGSTEVDPIIPGEVDPIIPGGDNDDPLDIWGGATPQPNQIFMKTSDNDYPHWETVGDDNWYKNNLSAQVVTDGYYTVYFSSTEFGELGNLPSNVTDICLPFIFDSSISGWLGSTYASENLKSITFASANYYNYTDGLLFNGSGDTLLLGLKAALADKTDIFIPTTVTKINNDAFQERFNESTSKVIHLHNLIVEIGLNAFSGFNGCILFDSCDFFLPKLPNDHEYTRWPDTFGTGTVNFYKNAVNYYNSIGLLNCNFYNADQPDNNVYIVKPQGNNLSLSLIFDNFADFYSTYSLIYQDTYIEEIILPENLETIPTRALYNQPYIKYIYIPSGVTRIEEYAFRLCPSTKRIGYNGTMEQFAAIGKGDYSEETGYDGKWFEDGGSLLYKVKCTDGYYLFRDTVTFTMNDTELTVPVNKSFGSSVELYCNLDEFESRGITVKQDGLPIWWWDPFMEDNPTESVYPVNGGVYTWEYIN